MQYNCYKKYNWKLHHEAEFLNKVSSSIDSGIKNAKQALNKQHQLAVGNQ